MYVRQMINFDVLDKAIEIPRVRLDRYNARLRP
jgi:hypothetical protein